MSMFHRSTRGFTLIELLVVIAIIGILSSVVLASLNSAREKSRDARRISDLKQIQLALELYYDAEGSYPSADSGDVDADALVSDGYIAAVPQDPNGGDYAYTQLDSGSNYHLGASLEDTDHAQLANDVDDQTANVNGVDTNGCSGEDGVACYDIKP